MPYVRTNEIDLYYEVHGNGPALVLGHGAGGNHLVWWQQVPDLARDYRVIIYDHRGFGLSRDVPSGPGRRAFALDLHGLLEHLGVEEFAMVAHSMAGRTATPFAFLFPGRLRALICSGTVGGVMDQTVREARARHAETITGITLRERALGPGIQARDPRLAYLYHMLNRVNPPRPRHFLAPPRGMRHWQEPSRAGLAGLPLPVLFLVGEHDQIVPPAVARAAHAALPGSEYVEIADAGHSAYFEQPEAFNQAVLDFLRRTWPP